MTIKSAKLALLTIAALLFSASSLYSYNRDLDVVRYVSATIKAVGWASSELEMEVLKFDHALTALAAGTRDEDHVQLRFELLWSRIDTLLEGEENRPMREQPGVKSLLLEFRQQLQQWESDVYQLSAGDRAAIVALKKTLAPYRQQARELNVDSFSGGSVWQQLDIIGDIRLRSTIYLGGLLISGGLMLWLLLRENRRNRYLAYHDMLTGLPNRMNFYQLMEQSLNRAQRDQRNLAVHMVDLNGFKSINDSLGHDVGDRVLKVVASRLGVALQGQGHVARLGGDEFVVIQPFDQRDKAEGLSEILLKTLAAEIRLPDGCLSPQASIGTSFYPEHGVTMAELLSHADTAMYYAKHDPKFSARVFEPGMDERRLRSQKLAVALQLAIENDELSLVYQPIFRLDGGNIESLEALLRWHSVEHGHISPLEIIAVAEHHGLAHQLNQWVLFTACRQLKNWHQQGHGWLKVNVNISPEIFMSGELGSTVKAVLQRTGLPASGLVLEITEDTSLWDTAGSLENLTRLRQLGVEIALDDFGTGYSSFSHLRQLPVNKLKIDKSFVSDLTTDQRAADLVHTIIKLAESLDMEVTAEGIELPEQQQRLLELGCQLGQGYLLARPLLADQVADWLQQDLQHFTPAG
ncbi:EAL domain-containing protein [Oceanimonas sp. CHS3-5]|uniref:putative bifunctional diguanylate cyclase/phosphodiesterase n=1 Tax=Oceanimonas sp. CHS3-5 TaxID=3068186 RepID=UPI00273FE3F6|nr:EAL domain-containing protein [Oceanimonas sp. CHS3-5]MDP5291040.1 EAL domain-containing protein [Oceanimonas sp. CHS3-5]